MVQGARVWRTPQGEAPPAFGRPLRLVSPRRERSPTGSEGQELTAAARFLYEAGTLKSPVREIRRLARVVVPQRAVDEVVHPDDRLTAWPDSRSVAATGFPLG